MEPESQAPAKHTLRDFLRTRGLGTSLPAAGLGLDPNDVPPRVSAAIETDEVGILDFLYNWQTLRADEGVGVTRERETGGRTCTRYPA